MTKKKLQFFFRAPAFPVFCKTSEGAFCAVSMAELNRFVHHNAAEIPDQCELIDSDWERWQILTTEWILMPVIGGKSFTKRELLLLCGVSEELVSKTNLDKYSRSDIFDFALSQVRRQA